MSEKIIKWTEQQRRAIVERGCDIFVTASAGTGKTAVLSGRCVDMVSDKSANTDINGIVVLTFTEAAAEQMRSRIAGQLKAAFDATGEKNLKLQLMLLQGADISTIHSFCKRLISEYFYKLGLDPNFAVIDSDEQKLLKAQTLEKSIEWAWQQDNLRQGLERLLRHRDLRLNDGFWSKVVETNDFLDSVVSRQDWFRRALKLAEVSNPFTTELGGKQKRIIKEKLQQILTRIEFAIRLYEGENPGGKWVEKWRENFVEPVAECIAILEADNWGDFEKKFRNFSKYPRFSSSKDMSELISGVIKSNVGSVKKIFGELGRLAVLNPEYLDKISGAVSMQSRIFVELVKKFDQLYRQVKLAANCLDFADLEHYALKLLIDESSTEGCLCPSPTAMQLRRRYKYIFVDEYQDINPVQQAILDMLGGGDNLFVVGDVKQSIYSFRGAEPDIFLEHLKPASTDSRDKLNGLRIDLNANFRSGKGILDFVNKVFGRIMTDATAKIDYDKSAQLKAAGKSESSDTGKPAVEMLVLDEQSLDSDPEQDGAGEFGNDDADIDIVSARQRQAAMIAQRIREMTGADSGKEQFQIYDKELGEKRAVEYRDIVILMRSLAKKANDYVEVLRLAGVPVSCEATAGYFETTEISDMICLLKILDNPQRDIEFAAVLRSPFFNVTDSELAEIKIHGREAENVKNFYEAVGEYGFNGSDEKLAQKLREALGVIGQWAGFAREGSLADLIWRVYRETNFLSFVSALPNGLGRKANLLKLHDRAIQFEGFASSQQLPSLSRFIEFIEKLMESGQDWAAAQPQGGAENKVRIISIHKSKGLEFGVVFLAELNGQFNKRDSVGDCLFDADDSIGLRVIDHELKIKLNSLAHQVIAEKKLAKGLAEEMRILYVAMTRAREKLILTASQKSKNCRAVICNGFLWGAGTIADWQLSSCKSSFEWLLYALCDQREVHRAFGTGLEGDCRCDNLFELKVYGQDELRRFSEMVLKLKADKSKPILSAAGKTNSEKTNSELLGQIKRSLGWQYGMTEAVFLPAKQSVTQLTHQNDEYTACDYSEALGRKPKAVLAGGSFSGGADDRRLIGSAAHLLIASLDLSRPVTREGIEETKAWLAANGSISAVVEGEIDVNSILGFFQSDIGKKVLLPCNTVLREWPFTFAMPAGLGGEKIIVQGIIDMLVRTARGLILVDFKTDNITAEQAGRRAENYRRQLQLYGMAAEAILGQRVDSYLLYFLTPGCAVGFDSL